MYLTERFEPLIRKKSLNSIEPYDVSPSTCFSVQVKKVLRLATDRDVIILILELSKSPSVSIDTLKEESKMPLISLTTLLERLQNQGLLEIKNHNVEINHTNRLELAVRAISLGGDVETVASFLQWQEFESVASAALRANGYEVKQNLQFKHIARRWEIDIVACKRPLVICIDCKDFHRSLPPSTARRIAEKQVERVRAFTDMLPSAFIPLDCLKWKTAKFVPIVLVLMPSRLNFCSGVPIVPVLQLQDFLHQLPFEIDSLNYFSKKFFHLGYNS